jgi:hypothetical protein
MEDLGQLITDVQSAVLKGKNKNVQFGKQKELPEIVINAKKKKTIDTTQKPDKKTPEKKDYSKTVLLVVAVLIAIALYYSFTKKTK